MGILKLMNKYFSFDIHINTYAACTHYSMYQSIIITDKYMIARHSFDIFNTKGETIALDYCIVMNVTY